MGNIEGDVFGDPVGCFEGSALMTAGAEPACLAGECQEFFVTAILAVQSSEALCEIPTAVEFFDNFDDIGSKWAVVFAVVGFIISLELIPAMMEDLPER